MSGALNPPTGDRTIIVRVPLRFRRHGGRKRMIATDQAIARPPAPKVDSTILKALGRAWRWKRLLDSGDYASVADLAASEKINHSYVRRLLRLTLLSPEIIEMILDGRLPRHVQLEDLLRPCPFEWERQADRLR